MEGYINLIPVIRDLNKKLNFIIYELKTVLSQSDLDYMNDILAILRYEDNLKSLSYEFYKMKLNNIEKIVPSTFEKLFVLKDGKYFPSDFNMEQIKIHKIIMKTIEYGKDYFSKHAMDEIDWYLIEDEEPNYYNNIEIWYNEKTGDSKLCFSKPVASKPAPSNTM